MLSRLRSRLTYANVMSSVAVFLALGGGAAWAANEFTGANIRNETLSGADVMGRLGVNGTLTGQDMRDGSVKRVDLGASARDSCPVGTSRLGRLCARTLSGGSKFFDAMGRCAQLGLRLPTYTEAILLSRSDIPGLPDSDPFWTDSLYTSSSGYRTQYVTDAGTTLDNSTEADYVRPVCVTTPST